MKAYLFVDLFYVGIFFWSGCLRGLSSFGSLAFRPVCGLPGHSTSYSFLVLYGLLASWFLGFLAFRPLGSLASRLLIASCILLYNAISNYTNKLLIYIYI